MKKKTKKTLKKISNFIVYETERKGLEYVGIETVMGDWRIEYRCDCTMYVTIHFLLEKEEDLLNFCTLMFVMSYTIHGKDVYAAMNNAIVKELKDVGIPEVGEEEDAKMLQDVVDMEDLKENIQADA